MKNITKETLKKDYEILKEMFHKYSNAIWEEQCGQKAHFDKQLKLIRIAMGDARLGIKMASDALSLLCEQSECIIED